MLCIDGILFAIPHTSPSILFASFCLVFYTPQWQAQRAKTRSHVFCYYSFALHTYILHEFFGITSSSSNRFNFDVINTACVCVCVLFFRPHYLENEEVKGRKVSLSLSLSLSMYICTPAYIRSLYMLLN
jgi:hypothetical protein